MTQAVSGAAATVATEHKVPVDAKIGEVSALLLRPEGARWLLVLGHGAGTDMRHRSMEATCQALAGARIATFRFNFPYKEHGRGAPDRAPVATATVRAAVRAAATTAPDLPMLAGGRSFGGRMTSTAAAQEPLPGVRGLVFYGFPLHTAGAPSTDRAAHLEKVGVPLLFLQGSKDALAELDLLRPVVKDLGRRATLHVVDGADHSFHVLKSSGRTDEEVLDELARRVHDWADAL
ncbi:MAG TPA: alpha/beta family hydrolase [Chloroflexota bacterium]|nr:alpha/beta family hydrolase [Chloroflexota bacterium]